MNAGQALPVVVGYDATARSVAALDWASAYALHRGAALTVLFAREYPGYPAGAVGRAPAPPAAALVAEATKIAEEGADRARSRAGGLEVSASPVFDGAASALVDASQSAQLVVVGDRGRGTLPGLLLGSVARTVSTHARCPVAVVREGNVVAPGPEMPVVAGVDDSEASARALDFAAELAHGYDAPLVVLSAWQTPLRPPWAGGERARARAGHEETQHMTTEGVVSGLVEGLRRDHPRLRVESSVREGHPATVLAEASRAAGLVVVGSRGRGGFTGLLLGSTSHNLVHTAACPVIVHRENAG
jgi:nucleotide-binding universal stress UspA family protein